MIRAVVLAASLLFSTVAVLPVHAAPPDPDFSGTWEMDSARSESTQNNGRVTVLIKQTPTEVSIETRQGDQSETLVYKLDGTPSEKPPQDNGAYEWRAQWLGSKLVTETHRNINRATVTVREARSLEPKGKEMLVERTLTVQHGYEMRGAKNYATGKDVFLKVSEEKKK